MSRQYHPYHLVDPSPWPFGGGVAALMTVMGAVLYFHLSLMGPMVLGLVGLVLVLVFWWRDVISEATFQGHHTFIVQRGLKMGMILFMVSEVCFFVSFFWAFFHSSLAPAIELGTVWPPKGVEVLNPFSVPLLNTAMLLSSGATVTWAHHSMISSNSHEAIFALAMTVLLGVMFTLLQGVEYYEAPFAMSDGIYGSTFFMATGFHGLHVIIGTTFLAVCFGRLAAHQFTSNHHFGFEAASWYWHFVDIVWLFLYICIYWWGS